MDTFVFRTPLHLASAFGNVEIMEELLAWKANVNIPDNEGKTPLFKVRAIIPSRFSLFLINKSEV